MTLVWVGKGHEGSGGDEVYDRKLITALRALNQQVTTVIPKRVSRVAELINLICGRPYYRARYFSSENLRRVAEGSQLGEATVISWEPFDQLAEAVRGPTILVLHNITSDALEAIYPNNIIIRLLSVRARKWESKLYRSPSILAIVVLSERDRRLVKSIAPEADCHLVPPGMPKCCAINLDASIRRELVLAGTYAWRPKLRDLRAFAKEYTDHKVELSILTDGELPQAVDRLLRSSPLAGNANVESNLRFGIVVDRFVSGHKLKVSYYIAKCCVVLSYVDVAEDFAGISDSELFIRKISHAGEIEAAIQSIELIPTRERNQRFRSFQEACAVRFDWAASAEKLASLLPSHADSHLNRDQDLYSNRN
jgi:hypothetical protein